MVVVVVHCVVVCMVMYHQYQASVLATDLMLTLSSVQTLDQLTSPPVTMINRVRLKLWNHWFWITIVMGNIEIKVKVFFKSLFFSQFDLSWIK